MGIIRIISRLSTLAIILGINIVAWLAFEGFEQIVLSCLSVIIAILSDIECNQRL